MTKYKNTYITEDGTKLEGTVTFDTYPEAYHAFSEMSSMPSMKIVDFIALPIVENIYRPVFITKDDEIFKSSKTFSTEKETDKYAEDFAGTNDDIIHYYIKKEGIDDNN